MVTGDENAFPINKHQSHLVTAILQFIKQQTLLALPLEIADRNGSISDIDLSRVNTNFPATTTEIAIAFSMPSSTTHDILKRLRASKKIRTRVFMWFKRKKQFHIPYEMTWPEYMFRTCGKCENWNRFTHSCTFFRELAKNDYKVDKKRLKHKILSSLTACKWEIARIKRALLTFPTLQDFAEQICDQDTWWHKEKRKKHFFSPLVPLPAFVCFVCERPFPELGWGVLPLIGSSIKTCGYCGSYYKLVQKKSTNNYAVLVSKEKFNEYAERYSLYTRGDIPESNHSSHKYGISLMDFEEIEDLHDNIDTFTSYNIFAFYNQLDYLVVRKKEHQEILQKRLNKEFPDIDVLLADEPTPSVEPTIQQKGTVALLKEFGVMNYPYSIELLWSKINVIEELAEFIPKRVFMSKQEKLMEILIELQQMEKMGVKLTTDQWNQLDGRAAKIIWEVIKPIMEKYGFWMPNRASARHLDDDRIKPYGLAHSYSSGNTIFNDAFRKITNVFIEKCNKHKFPWNGLEGICHKKTSKGIYGFLLDNSEGLKQATFPTTIRAVADGTITPEMVKSARMRKRIEVFYLEVDKKGDKQMKRENEKLLSKKVMTEILGEEKKVSFEEAIEYQVVSLGRLFEDVIWLDDSTVKINNIKYAPWLIAVENRWEELSAEQKKKIGGALKEILEQAKSYFKPFRYQLEFSDERFDFKL